MRHMNSREVEQTVLSTLNTILKQSFESPNDISVDNTDAWNSLKHIEIMFALEDEFNVEFSQEELSNLKSFSKIVNALQAKIDEA